MIKLTFKFDERILKENHMTADEMLFKIREYADENNIRESSFGVFEKDGEDAMSLLLMMVTEIVAEIPGYIKYLTKLELDANGEIEDCIGAVERWLNKNK